MPHELTHASFFSGVGGLDRGLERAGWRTVSFSEIDPYASAVLADRWPGVPNLGDIVALAGDGHSGESRSSRVQQSKGGRLGHAAGATLWTGGFPCQDLSVAGKRRGMGTEDERTRSGLAYAFLDLVERHRPPAILLENVPGLLSSNGGKDLGALLSRLGELGYWWAYRILDAQFFGVPQRRRRVFICALHAGAGFGADSAAAVLSVGTRCGGHSAESDEARTGVALGLGDRTELAGSLTRRYGKGINTTLDDGATVVANGLRASDGHHGYSSPRGDGGDNLLVSPSPDADRVREADGLAGRSHHRAKLEGAEVDAQPPDLAYALRAEQGKLKQGWNQTFVARHEMVAGSGGDTGRSLPLGLDSHRYRCCGNGVVSNVSEWIGHRLARAVA